MNIEASIIVLNGNGNVNRQKLGDNITGLRFDCPTILAIDGSTTCTGVAFIRKADGAYMASVAFKRDKVAGETPVEYKVAFKRALKIILDNNRESIADVVYEEPFIEFASAAKNLLMLRTSVEELIAENKPNMNYIKYAEVANGKWKRIFLAPGKVPSGTEAQKEAVRTKLIAAIPVLAGITQDECDAIGIGFVAASEMRAGREDSLKSRKKIRPFAYEVEFYGADDDDEALEQISMMCKAPKELMASQVGFSIVEKYTQFDQLVCETIGETDTLQIIRIPTKKCGNLSLKYQLAYITGTNIYLYAVVWRKTRKR